MKSWPTPFWLGPWLLRGTPVTHLKRSKQREDPQPKLRIVLLLSSSRSLKRALSASGNPSEATRILAPALAESRKAGLLRYELEARLASAEIEIKSGNARVGRADLTLLEKEATAKGFLLIARNANAL